MHAPVTERRTELVRSYRKRRERGRRLRVEKTETLGRLRRDQVSEREIVREHEQPEMAARVGFLHAPRRVAEHDTKLGLEVQTPLGIWKLDVVSRAEQHARATL